MTITVRVSGKAYFAALDPLATGSATEGIPTPTLIARGRGTQAVYDVDPDIAVRIYWRLIDVGDSFAQGEDEATRIEGRACLAVARRLQIILQRQGYLRHSQGPLTG